MDIDGVARFVLQVVERRTVACGIGHPFEGGELADAARWTREASVVIGQSGDDGDQSQIGLAPESVRQEASHVLRPEVLVFDVDQLSSAPERLDVRPGDAPLSIGRVRERRVSRGVRPQHLHRVHAGARRVCWHRWERARPTGLADRTGDPASERVAVIERRRVLPTLPKRVREVADRGTPNLHLDVVPRRTRPVAPVHLNGLRIALVALVVTPAMAEVDSTDEGDVVVLVTQPTQQEELLVVGSSPPHTLVEEYLPTGLVDALGKVGVLLLAEASEVRTPEQAAHLDTATSEIGEHDTDLGAGPVEALVVVAPPVGEVQVVTALQRLQRPIEPSEVRRSVDEGLHGVAGGPRPPVATAPIELCRRIAALLGREEPVRRAHHAVLTASVPTSHPRPLSRRASYPRPVDPSAAVQPSARRDQESERAAGRLTVVGVPVERKDGEHRVALTPDGVRELVAHGHRVLVERGAGAGSSIADEEFGRAGADLVSADDAWGADLVVKVKEPQAEEYGYLRADLVLFTYLHLAAYPEVASALLEAKTTALAYETVQLESGALPLLAPMSEVAGRMATQIGAHYLEAHNGGRGVLLGGAPGVRPARCVVIGAGNVGWNAAWIAQGMEAEVWLLDKSVDRLRWVDQIHQGRIMTLASNRGAVERAVPQADLLIGAVLIPGGRAPNVVTEDMVRSMQPGSVIVDIAVDQGGCIETTHETTHADPVYERFGIIHYAVGNVPGAVPHTSTYALTNATLPYISALADHGVREAVAHDPALLGGVTTVAGAVTNPAVAEALGHEPSDPLRHLQA
jgi:alanine dehydrogenase